MHHISFIVYLCRKVVEAKDKSPVEVSFSSQRAKVDVSLLFFPVKSFYPAAHRTDQNKALRGEFTKTGLQTLIVQFKLQCHQGLIHKAYCVRCITAQTHHTFLQLSAIFPFFCLIAIIHVTKHKRFLCTKNTVRRTMVITLLECKLNVLSTEVDRHSSKLKKII